MNQPVSDAFHSARAFVRQRIAGPRAVALLSGSVLLSLLAGCGHTVRFADLKPIVQVADVAPLRHAFQHGLENGLPHSGDYLVSPADLIELKAADGSPVLPISDICAAPCWVCRRRPDGSGSALGRKGPQCARYCLCTQSVGALRIGQKQVCRARPRTALEPIANGPGLTGVVPSILPQPTRWAMPGDTVRVAVEIASACGRARGSSLTPLPKWAPASMAVAALMCPPFRLSARKWTRPSLRAPRRHVPGWQPQPLRRPRRPPLPLLPLPRSRSTAHFRWWPNSRRSRLRATLCSGCQAARWRNSPPSAGSQRCLKAMSSEQECLNGVRRLPQTWNRSVPLPARSNA